MTKLCPISWMSHNIYTITGEFPDPYFEVLEEIEEKAFKKPEKKKRELSEKQKEALAKGREKQKQKRLENLKKNIYNEAVRELDRRGGEPPAGRSI